MKRNIRDFDLQETEKIAAALSEKPFRAKQLYGWLHRNLAGSGEEMHTLPLKFREALSEQYDLCLPEPVQAFESPSDGTRKFLFRMADGHVIESVFMRYHHGDSVCVSSQVGCRMGCRFCASTIGGLVRSLTAGEILGQVYRIQSMTGERISNVVIMGSGEPLDNYEEVTKFIRLLTDENGLHLSRRNITVSTCGLVPEIRRLADEQLGVTLALSLHAPDDEIRKQLMPIANRYPLREVMDAVKYYFSRTGRRITFEYSVVRGVNDTVSEAEALAALIRKTRGREPFMCHVNLIPVNPVRERDFERPDRTQVEKFQAVLEARGINATIRREMGTDIGGACGQLRRDYLGEKDTDGFLCKDR